VGVLEGGLRKARKGGQEVKNPDDLGAGSISR